MLRVVSVRDQVGRLKGHTLFTLGRRCAFDVVDIASGSVEIRLHSTGKKSRVSRRRIERAWELLESAGSLTQKEIKEGASRYNYSYVAAILAALPGVKHTGQPVELRLA